MKVRLLRMRAEKFCARCATMRRSREGLTIPLDGGASDLLVACLAAADLRRRQVCITFSVWSPVTQSRVG